MEKIFLTIILIFVSYLTYSQQLEKGLIAYWSFDDKDTVIDYSGNGANGYLQGAEIRNGGISGNALYLNGKSYVKIPKSLNLKNNFSIAFWIKPETIEGQRTVFNQQDNQNVKMYNFGIDNNIIYVKLGDDKRDENSSLLSNLGVNEWKFLVFTVNNNELTIYENLKKQSINISFNVTFNNDSDDLFIGIDKSLHNGFIGLIDEMIVYNRLLEDNELKKIFNKDFPKKTNTMIASNKLNKSQVIVPIISQNQQDTTNKKPCPCPDCLTLPLKINDSEIEYRQVVKVKSSNITIFPYDNAEEDGDIVSININGVWILEHYTLKNRNINENKNKKFKITLQPNLENYIISYAWNVGKLKGKPCPPNTLTVEIVDDTGFKQYIPINSDIGISGAIKIIYEP